MLITKTRLAAALALASLTACGGTTADRSTDAACAMVVTKALELLPDGVRVDVQEIEAGRSGSAVSCSVSGSKTNILVDATVTCRGSANELATCTTIDAIHGMAGEVFYEK